MLEEPQRQEWLEQRERGRENLEMKSEKKDDFPLSHEINKLLL